MNIQEIIAQSIGVVGATIAILSFQCKSSKTMFILQGVSATLFSIHFGLLGAMTGLIQNVLAIIRCYLLRCPHKWASSRIVPWIFAVIFVGTGILTFDGFFSVLPPLAMIVSTFAMWTKNGSVIRVAQLTGVSPLWLTYNFSVGSISGCITEGFNIVSVVVSFLRYGIHGFDQKETVEQTK